MQEVTWENFPDFWKTRNRGHLAIFKPNSRPTPISVGPPTLFSTFLTSKWLLNHQVWLSIELEISYESWEEISRFLENFVMTIRPLLGRSPIQSWPRLDPQTDINLFPTFLASSWILNHRIWLSVELEISL